MKMPRTSPADAATLSSRDLIEELQNPVPDAPFVTFNDTHHAALKSLAEIFNIIPKDSEKITDRHYGRRSSTQ